MLKSKEILKKYGFIEFPQLNFSSVMLLRKTSIEKNWIKVLEYINDNDFYRGD